MVLFRQVVGKYFNSFFPVPGRRIKKAEMNDVTLEVFEKVRAGAEGLGHIWWSAHESLQASSVDLCLLSVYSSCAGGAGVLICHTLGP